MLWVCDKSCVLNEKVKTQQQQNKKWNIKPLLEPGMKPRTSPPSRLRVTIVVKLFNLFDAIGRTVNKQRRICGPHIFNKFVFSVIFLHAWITILGSFSYILFTGVGFTAQIWLKCKHFRPKRYRHSFFNNMFCVKCKPIICKLNCGLKWVYVYVL